MAKRGMTVDDGGQLDLIDVAPKNAKEIKRAARAYKKAQAQRITWLEDEKKCKAKILELVMAAKLQPLEGGVIRFQVDGMIIAVTPRDELVQVKDDGGGTEDEE
jgi:hypothetical protein